MSMQVNINPELAETLPFIKYIPALAAFCDNSFGANIFFNQIEFYFSWAKKNGKNCFYKLLTPVSQESKPLYMKGDSWLEALQVKNEGEVRRLLGIICNRHNSKTEFDAANKSGDVFNGKFFCYYIDRRTNVTYYFRNDLLVERVLLKCLGNSQPFEKVAPVKPQFQTAQNEVLEASKTQPQTSQSAAPDLGFSQLPNTKITTQITPNTTTTMHTVVCETATNTQGTSVVVDKDLENLVAAAVWKFAMINTVRNINGLKSTIRNRFKDLGITADERQDLVDYNQYLIEKEIVEIKSLEAAESNRCVEEETKNRARERANLVLDQLSGQNRAQLLADFEVFIKPNARVFDQFVRRGLSSRLAKDSLITFIISRSDLTNSAGT